ncbi:MAG: sulfatase [Anaerolineae bacterium]|nr:MAG: sulfatase [Anaerolineae bacterium]
MAEQEKKNLTRRGFLKGSLIAGSLLAAGGVGYRLVVDYSGRDYDPSRSETLLARVQPSEHPDELANMIVVLADDLGYGDLGCFGSQAIHTPHLDQMAAEGVRMTNFYATASLCSPSRAGLLTGRYPIRSHITMPLYPSGSLMDLVFRVGGVYPYGVRGIPQDEVLLPEVLQQRGYRTAMLGKWHLGDRSPHLPNENGFDFFYGAHFSNDMPSYTIYRNERVEIEPPADQSDLTQRLTQEGIRFIRENKGHPFFLCYAQPFPHVPLHASEGFRGRSKAGLYGDTVEELDWSVGQILATLKEQGLDENTLVIFTSDNGPWWQGSAGPTRGRKNLAFEGGLRVPFVARWPGAIPAETVADEMSMNFDIFATCLAAAGVPLPVDRIVDGQNMLPVLQGEPRSLHETLYYYKGRRLLGVRHGNWKYLRRHMTDNGGYASLSQGPFLFNLELDPDESYSLIESEPEVAGTLVKMLDDWEAEIRRNVRGWL